MTTTRELHDARTDLHEILRLTANLPDEATTRGTTTSEAANLNGASANPDAWYQRIAHGWTPSPDNADHHHPRWVLAVWDRNVRAHYGHGPRATTPTVASMAAYIDRNLTDLADAETFRFDVMADALSACRSHLESVLHDGEQIESGAPCMTCHRPIRKDSTDPDNPTYRCTTCHRDLNANEYRLAVQAAHLKHADRLNVTDLAERIEVPASTIRRWASVIRIQPVGSHSFDVPALIRPCGRDGKGRKVYRVAEALRIRNTGGDTRRSDKMKG